MAEAKCGSPPPIASPNTNAATAASSAPNAEAASNSPQSTPRVAPPANATPRDNAPEVMPRKESSVRPAEVVLDSAASGKIDATRSVVPSLDLFEQQLDQLGKAVMACDDIADSLKAECGELLVDVQRITTKTKLECHESAREMSKGRARDTSAVEDEPAPTIRAGGASAAASQAKMRKSWDFFLTKIQHQMSPQEAELLSLKTVKQLMHHFHIDRNPVDVANIELFWREQAQQRERERRAKSMAAIDKNNLEAQQASLN